MKSKKQKNKKADSLKKIILLSIHYNVKTVQLHLKDSLKMLSPDTEAAKSLMMAERALNACIQETVKLIETIY